MRPFTAGTMIAETDVAKTVMPRMITDTVKRRASTLAGTMSPKPTVDMVSTAKYSAVGRFLMGGANPLPRV